ncbi:synaptonemal complex protein 2 isoform X2 [Tachysurus ichikawai]
MARLQDKQVEEFVDQALKNNFQPLEEFLLIETREGITSKCSRQFISKLDKLISRELDQQNVKNASVVFTIFPKLGNTLVFPEGKGISLMVSQGLVKKISMMWFEKVRKIWVEAGPTRNELFVNLAEDFFDALMVIHESCKEGTFQVTESLLHHIGKLASDPQVNILIQKEAVRKLNMILGKIPLQLKKEKKILSSQEASIVMSDLTSRIIKGGDYDLQVALMEALCRMTSRAQRRQLADLWFRMEFVASAFNKIQDTEFETDCRKFLNLVNGMQGDDRSVYSYPCLEVFLDKHVLLMPVDENLHEFWIDFNVGSQSISFYFCLADDESKDIQWDTLCITENEVHSYTVEEEKDIKVLQLVLTEPVCLSSIEGTRLHIHFSSSLDILKATKKVYGETKNKKFIGKTTTSVVKTTVQIILDEGDSQVLVPESQGSSQHVEKTVPSSVRSDTYSASRKAKLKPALELIASSEKRKALEIKEPLTAKLSHSLQTVIVEKESTKKQHIPVEKVVEMVQTDPELQEEPLDNGIVLDTQPAVWKETSILPSPSCFYKKRISVSGSLFPCQRESSRQFRSEPPQQPLSAQSSSGGLSHKQLHTQLTQRLEQVLREREQQEQHPQEHFAAGKEAGLVKSLTQTKLGTAEQSASAKGNGACMSNNTIEKAAKSMVKQINSHYNRTAISTAAQEHAPLFNIAPTSGSSMSLSSTSKKCTPMKPAGHNVKKHLFSDTDTDNMTEISWLKSANRKPKPKVADYTRQPVKPTHLPTTFTFETPNIPIPSPKCAQALPKQKRKRQKKLVEEKNKTSKNVANRKPTVRAKRTSVMTRSYREVSDSELETDEPAPAKKFIIKQPEKPQRPGTVKPPVKRNSEVRSNKVHKLVNEKEKKKSDYEKSKQKKMTATVGSTKGKENVLAPKITPLCLSTLSSSIIKSVEKRTAMLRPALAPLNPMFKTSQAVAQEGKIDGIIEQAEKKKETPGITTTHPVTNGTFMEEKAVSEILGSEWSKNRKNLLSPVLTKETWASKNTSFCLSPLSIEKKRSEEKNASLPSSPLTPLPPLCISPVGAISPPLDLPSHLKGIQASSFYKSSGGPDIAKSLSHPFVTPFVQGQSAGENAELRSEQPFLHPLIASTGRKKCPSMLNSPDQEEDLSGFLNSSNKSILQTFNDKESVVSLVSLSQSSHTSVNNIATICTELEKTPASVQGSSVKKAESGPTTKRTWHSSCSSTSLSEQDGSECDMRIKARHTKPAVRMKPRKLFKPNVTRQSKKKGSKQPIEVDSSTEEGEKDKGSVTEVRSTVVSSCWEAGLETDMDLVQSEVSTSQEMSYVCRQFSSEITRKFENRSRRMDLFTKQSIKVCRQHVSNITMKVQEYRFKRLEAVKQVLMDEMKNLEQDDTSLRDMEAELAAYWKKQALDFHAYQERGTERLNNLRSTIETNLGRNLDYEEQIFFSQMHLMKKDMKSVQDHLVRQMHEEELQSPQSGGPHPLFSPQGAVPLVWSFSYSLHPRPGKL